MENNMENIENTSVQKHEEALEEEFEDKIKYPCTYLSKLKIMNDIFLKKTLKSYEIYKRNKAQQRDMNNLRDIMEKRKNRYLCHLKERKMQAKKQLQKNCREFEKEHWYFGSKSSDFKIKVMKKFNDYSKQEKIDLAERRKRMVGIVQKILNEQKRQEQIDAQKKKVYYEIGKPKKKKRPVLEEDDSEEEICETDYLERSIEEIVEPEMEIPESEPVEIATTSNEKRKSSTKTLSIHKSAISKTKRMSKSSKSSGSRRSRTKSKASISELPPIPHTNPRERIETTSEIDFDALEAHFEDTDKLIKSHEQFRKPEKKYPVEVGFSWKPKSILFDNFDLRKTNYQKVIITNNGPETKKLIFGQISTSDDFREGIIEVEPLTLQKLSAGTSFATFLYFRPEPDFKDLNGEIIFYTWTHNNSNKTQFSIPFQCVTHQAKVKISPKPNIVFPNKTFWTYWNWDKGKKPTTNMDIQNESSKSCKLIIRKENIPDGFLDIVSRGSREFGENDYIRKVPSEDLSIHDFVVERIIEPLLKYVEMGFFFFNTYIVDLPPRSKKTLKIQWKNAAFCGSHIEKYKLITMERKKQWETTNEDSIQVIARITGDGITLDPDVLDFGTCIFDAAYQTHFSFINGEAFPINIGFRLPSRIKECITIFPSNASIKTNSQTRFSIKFVPRKELLANIYFQRHFNILDFPIKIYVLTPKNNAPPIILNAYAILTSANEVFVRPSGKTPFMEDNGKILINLGKVSTQEIVYCDLEIENCSLLDQEYGFLNLPEYVTISPDFGFGILKAGEVKKLVLYCSPNIHDIPTKYSKKQKYDDDDYTIITSSTGTSSSSNIDHLKEIRFKIKCSTITGLGGLSEAEVKKLKRKGKTKDPKAQLLEHFKFGGKPHFPSLQEERSLEMESLNEHFGEITTMECFQESDLIGMDIFPEDRIEDLEEGIVEKTIKIQTIHFVFEIVDNWCELSSQVLKFPDTPMGSFTIAETNLNAFNQTSIQSCVCGYLKGKKITNFRCKFEFIGGTDELMIEPTCGELNFGETKKITLIASPKIEERILEEKAEIYRTFRIQKEKEEEDLKKKSKGKKPPKGTKGEDKKKKGTSELDVDFKNDNRDLYSAEKELWRFVEPYEISTKFSCMVNFINLPEKEPEILYIEAKCLVVKPAFILNTETQVLDFGPVAIGAEKRLNFQIENISEKEITPIISFINPKGPFECFVPKIKLEREHILTVSVLMKPTSESQPYQEYKNVGVNGQTVSKLISRVQEKLDIECGTTKSTLILKGEIIELEYEMKPSFVVCRLETKLGSKSDCTFTIINKCQAPMDLKIKKLFELEGTFVKVPEEFSEKSLLSKDKQKPKKEVKPKKLSNDLTEDEYYSLDNENFFKFDTEPKFSLTTEEKFVIEPDDKSVIKIKFELPNKIFDPNGKEKREGGYVSKYEIWLSEITLLHDFFIIGRFNSQ